MLITMDAIKTLCGILFVVEATSLFCLAKSAPQVATESGVVEGSVMWSVPSGRQFFAFRGIPYGQPPIQELRFRAPQPAKPWHGVLDATKDPPDCIQINFLLPLPEVTGQEDCLYLNIYTPTLPKVNETYELLPVMVYIYGGGFFSGTSNSAIHGPEYLLSKDVVLVTFNYRVGVMGFLSTGTSHVPGNAGLKDQVAVLKWVQKNAKAFGGNPDKVTIFGQSAGAVSVHYHMLSQMSVGLFHRAIAQSGVALSVWSWGSTQGPNGPSLGSVIAQFQANFVNCSTETTEIMVNCLKSMDAVTLVNSTTRFQTWDRDPLVIYAPVIEPTTNAITEEERFITVSPFTLIKEGQVQPVPFMLGVVPSEGTVRAGAILGNEVLLKDFNARPEQLGPFLLGLGFSVENRENIVAVWDKISKYFFENRPISAENEDAFVEMYGDRLFTHAVYHAALMHKALDIASVYLYQFTYKGVYSFVPLLSHNANASYGVGHCDDLIYLFQSKALFPAWPEGHPDTQMRNTMVELWTNFAIFGTPTPNGNGDVVWNPLQACEPLEYANITTNFSTGNADFYNERMLFWENLPLLENTANDKVKQIVSDSNQRGEQKCNGNWCLESGIHGDGSNPSKSKGHVLNNKTCSSLANNGVAWCCATSMHILVITLVAMLIVG